MTQRLESVWFTVPGGSEIRGATGVWPGGWYERHAFVLDYSARQNSPGWEVSVRNIGPPKPRRAARLGGGRASYVYNTWKLENWLRIVKKSQPGDRLLVMDSDMMVLRPLDDVWDIDFDVAITAKRGLTRIPLNGGVVFLRVNERSRAFFESWWEWNLKLLGDAALHDHYWKTYAGMNQAALGALLENGDTGGAKVAELRCEEWNCESGAWKLYDPQNPPRIVHVKGDIRRAIMAPHRYSTNSTQRKQIIAKWQELEQRGIAARA